MGLFKKQVKPELYPSELEHLIDIAIEDGIITDKERCVLHKKATMLNIDPDELDMVLESRLNKGSVKETSIAQPSGMRRTGPKKCPSCGAVLSDSNTAHCPYCGYKVVNIVRDILEEINSVTVPKKVEDFSVNLKAPIVINMNTNKGAQIITEDDYPVKCKVYDLLKGNTEKAGE